MTNDNQNRWGTVVNRAGSRLATGLWTLLRSAAVNDSSAPHPATDAEIVAHSDLQRLARAAVQRRLRDGSTREPAEDLHWSLLSRFVSLRGLPWLRALSALPLERFSRRLRRRLDTHVLNLIRQEFRPKFVPGTYRVFVSQTIGFDPEGHASDRPSARDPALIADEDEQLDQLAQAFAKFDDFTLLVLAYRYRDGASFRSIARTLRCTEYSVRAALTRALSQLRVALRVV